MIRVVGAAITRQGKVLVAQRSERMLLPLKWEFPGGKIEAGESPEAALVREIREELALDIQVGSRLGGGTALSGGRRVHLVVYGARSVQGQIALVEHAAISWALPEELHAFDWAEADIPIVKGVRDWLCATPS